METFIRVWPRPSNAVLWNLLQVTICTQFICIACPLFLLDIILIKCSALLTIPISILKTYCKFHKYPLLHCICISPTSVITLPHYLSHARKLVEGNQEGNTINYCKYGSVYKLFHAWIVPIIIVYCSTINVSNPTYMKATHNFWHTKVWALLPIISRCLHYHGWNYSPSKFWFWPFRIWLWLGIYTYAPQKLCLCEQWQKDVNCLNLPLSMPNNTK